MSIRKLIRETIENHLNEIDWGGEFSDVGAHCLNPTMVVKWLNDELERINVPEKEREKRSKSAIIATRGNIESLMDDMGSINLDRFISNITMEPDRIFDKNPKMEKSDIGRPQLTVNTGLPAIVAIVYDIQNKKFYKVTTCPAAGKCTVGCYARKGFYGMDDSKTMRLTRRINLLMNDPEKYKQMAIGELEPLAKNLKVSSIGFKDKMQLVIRWNDAGDFFGQRYFNIAKEITKELLDKGYDVKSYAYTKRGDYVMELDNDDNFVINFSTDASKPEQERIKSFDKDSMIKMAHRVPREVFKGIFQKKGPHYLKGITKLPLFVNDNSPEELKDRIYEKYKDQFNITRDSLMFTFELPSVLGKKGQYNVIILPTGDSDIAGQRSDVRISFLLEH